MLVSLTVLCTTDHVSETLLRSPRRTAVCQLRFCQPRCILLKVTASKRCCAQEPILKWENALLQCGPLFGCVTQELVVWLVAISSVLR